MILTILDIIGAISGIIGAIGVMYKNKYGYIAFMLCNIAYFILGLLQGFYGLVIVSTVMLIIDVLAYIRWSKEPKQLLKKCHKLAWRYGLKEEDIQDIIKEVRKDI